MKNKVTLGITITFDEDVSKEGAKTAGFNAMDALVSQVMHTEKGLAPEGNYTKKIQIVSPEFSGIIEKTFGS